MDNSNKLDNINESLDEYSLKDFPLKENTYIGEYRENSSGNRIKEGLGVKHYPNGNVYIGEWKNDKPEGFGFCISNEKGYIAIGQEVFDGLMRDDIDITNVCDLVACREGNEYRGKYDFVVSTDVFREHSRGFHSYDLESTDNMDISFDNLYKEAKRLAKQIQFYNEDKQKEILSNFIGKYKDIHKTLFARGDDIENSKLLKELKNKQRSYRKKEGELCKLLDGDIIGKERNNISSIKEIENNLNLIDKKPDKEYFLKMMLDYINLDKINKRVRELNESKDETKEIQIRKIYDNICDDGEKSKYLNNRYLNESWFFLNPIKKRVDALKEAQEKLKDSIIKFSVEKGVIENRIDYYKEKQVLSSCISVMDENKYKLTKEGQIKLFGDIGL